VNLVDGSHHPRTMIRNLLGWPICVLHRIDRRMDGIVSRRLYTLRFGGGLRCRSSSGFGGSLGAYSIS